MCNSCPNALHVTNLFLPNFSKAWSHRQWIIRTLNNSSIWKSEIEYSHTKIREDPRNNSAWSQRWFATHRGKVAFASGTEKVCGTCNDLREKGIILSLELAGEEAHYAICGAELDPYNESPWRYLIGVLMEQWRSAKKEGSANEIDKVNGLISTNIAEIKKMNQSLKINPPSEADVNVPCVSLMSALVDLLEMNGNKSSLDEATTLCMTLTEVDRVRRKYWRKREVDIRNTNA